MQTASEGGRLITTLTLILLTSTFNTSVRLLVPLSGELQVADRTTNLVFGSTTIATTYTLHDTSSSALLAPLIPATQIIRVRITLLVEPSFIRILQATRPTTMILITEANMKSSATM